MAWSSASAHISLIDGGAPDKTVSFEFETTKAQTSRYPRLKFCMHVINETRRFGNYNILQLERTGSYNLENSTNCFHRDHSFRNTAYSSLLSFMYSTVWSIKNWVNRLVAEKSVNRRWCFIESPATFVDCSFPIRNRLRLSDLLD